MNDLGFWMVMFTIGALAYYETPLGRVIRAVVRAAFVYTQNLIQGAVQQQPRDQLGRWASSGEPGTAGGNERERPLPAVPSDVTASESGVSAGNGVTSEVTIDEAIFITAHLVQGVAPSNVIKQLPGFTPKHYHASKAKVDRVKAILAEQAEDGGTPSA